MKRLKEPPENSLPEHIVDISDATTPPNALRIVPTSIPPPLTRGRRFRPIDSPEESVVSTEPSNNADISGIQELLTPEKTFLNSPSIQRQLDLKSLPVPSTATKRPTDSSAASDATSPKQRRTSPRNNRNRFGPLLYLKANGKLRHHRNTKHRGVTAPSTPTASSVESGIWDREVSLLASYRLCLVDNTPQFALIVYEQRTRNPKTRRNLFAEFQTSSDDEDEESHKKPSQSEDSPTATEMSTMNKAAEVVSEKHASATPKATDAALPATPIMSTVEKASTKQRLSANLSSAKKISLRRLRF